MKKTYKVIITLFCLILTTYLMFFRTNKSKFDLKYFDFEEIKRGDISRSITASGSINPVNVINVGTQVSGTIERIFVDYNDAVKKGQILAELDTSILKRSLTESESRVKKAKASLDLVILNTKRTRTLYKSNYIAKIELDQAETELKTAREEYNIARSQNEIAKINLGYATITSPVSGVVISREIDVGQTVAASFSAPVLFKIAEDLTKMQIETSISEADIGSIRNGMNVQFTIDSYPNQKFEGTIRQIRLNPATEQNVVVYNVIIEIENKDNKILPGMTAYVSVPVGEAKDVLYVKSIAFRFNPDDETLKVLGLERPPRRTGYAILYKLASNNKVEPIYVQRGLSSLSDTELISDDIKEGDRIISNTTLTVSKKK